MSGEGRADPSRRRRASVCVVIPTHNRPVELRRAVESVAAQEFEGVAIVVVDDGSEPAVRDAFPDAAGVRIVRHQEPRGPAAARNRGADAVDSDFVAFLDDDDYWLPGKLEAVLACFDRHREAGAVIHRAAFPGARDAGSGRCALLSDPVRRMLHAQPPHLDAVVVRREVHDRVRFDESFAAAEDLDYLVRVATQAAVAELDRVLAVHAGVERKETAISMERRVEARLRFREKHRALFDPEAEAFFQLRLGHIYRRAGRRGNASRAFARAMRLRPTWALPWKGLASLAMPSAVLRKVARR